MMADISTARRKDARKAVPSGEDYPAWKANIAEMMEAGREFWNCGQPV
jgi:hypothetical protein